MKTTTFSYMLCLSCAFGNTQNWYPWLPEGWQWEFLPVAPQTQPSQWWSGWPNAQMQPVNQVPAKPTTTPKIPVPAYRSTTPKPKPGTKPCQHGASVDGSNQCKCGKNPVGIIINNQK